MQDLESYFTNTGYYLTTNIQRFYRRKQQTAYLSYIQKLQKVKVLIIDDFAMQPITSGELSDLLDIIEERDQLGPVIITTQYPPGKWHKLFDDPTAADAICDRLITTAIKLNLKGNSKFATRKHKKNKGKDLSKMGFAGQIGGIRHMKSWVWISELKYATMFHSVSFLLRV